MVFEVGDLVRVSGLQSEQGLQLNGSLGKVVSCANPPRFGVMLYSARSPGSTQDTLHDISAANLKSFNCSNLTLHNRCCPLYLDLCLSIVHSTLLSAPSSDTLAKGVGTTVGIEYLKDYNSRKPDDLAMAATLANIVRDNGEFELAVQLTSNVIANLSTAPPQLRGNEHRLRYDLGCSLLSLGRAAEAFHQANAIDVGRGGEPVELKSELLDEIASSLKFQRPHPTADRCPARDSASRVPENPRRSYTLELELQVRRERVHLQHTRQHGISKDPIPLLELAALLCRLGSPQQLEEGIETYGSALQASRPIIPFVIITLSPPRQLCISQTDHRLQATIEKGLEIARYTRAANLADGQHGRLLGADGETFWFIDSKFIEGVHYAMAEDLEEIQRLGTRIQLVPGFSTSAPFRSTLINLSAPVSSLLLFAAVASCLAANARFRAGFERLVAQGDTRSGIRRARFCSVSTEQGRQLWRWYAGCCSEAPAFKQNEVVTPLIATKCWHKEPGLCCRLQYKAVTFYSRNSLTRTQRSIIAPACGMPRSLLFGLYLHLFVSVCESQQNKTCSSTESKRSVHRLHVKCTTSTTYHSCFWPRLMWKTLPLTLALLEQNATARATSAGSSSRPADTIGKINSGVPSLFKDAPEILPRNILVSVNPGQTQQVCIADPKRSCCRARMAPRTACFETE